MNNFLDQIGVSPLKKTLRVDWSAASDRTKADHLRKAQQTIKGVLALIAPNQEEILQEQLFPSKNANLLESVASSYESMTSWGVQRQILSLLVQDYNYAELKTHIPSLSRYKFSAARKHGIRVGQGMPVGDFHGPKVKVKDDNIAHFMEFITSPAIMTDSPFGESTFKLSSGKIIKASKIILNSVRSRTVDLYMKYCEETEYQNILSERTYMRILETVEPKIRKSMKGLDNYAAEGAQAFDDLKACVSQIGQIGKGAQWVESTRRVLNDGKTYLKMEYKVNNYLL